MHFIPNSAVLCYRTSVAFTEEMAAWIETEAFRLGVSHSDLIRECVQRVMNNEALAIKGKETI